MKAEKARLIEALRLAGWRVDPKRPGCLRAPPFLLDRLVKKSFHPYEAEILQELLMSLDDNEQSASPMQRSDGTNVL